jgi:hypothetical protein
MKNLKGIGSFIFGIGLAVGLNLLISQEDKPLPEVKVSDVKDNEVHVKANDFEVVAGELILPDVSNAGRLVDVVKNYPQLAASLTKVVSVEKSQIAARKTQELRDALTKETPVGEVKPVLTEEISAQNVEDK